jgi:hypothetical protein
MEKFDLMLVQIGEFLDSFIPKILFWTEEVDQDDPDGEPFRSVEFTIGYSINPETGDHTWDYQTGDNSYTGGAYRHPDWLLATITPDCTSAEVISQLRDHHNSIMR